MERGEIPQHVAEQMEDTIRKTAENAINKSEQEVDWSVDTSILETLPWTDYGELYRKLEERGEKRGVVIGEKRGEKRGIMIGEERIKARDMEAALGLFSLRNEMPLDAIARILRIQGISPEVIERARIQTESENAMQQPC